MRKDPRPTKAEFDALPRHHQHKLTRLTDAKGQPLTREANRAILHARLERRKGKQSSRKPRVVKNDDRNHEIQSTGAPSRRRKA